MKVEYIAGLCPKGCGREAGYNVVGVGVWLVCTCGYRFLKYELDHKGHIVEAVSSTSSLVKLPKETTMLYSCLLVIHKAERITTKEASIIRGMSSCDMATQLTLLEGKGLVSKVKSLRRVAGGSTWVLTVEAKTLMKGV